MTIYRLFGTSGGVSSRLSWTVPSRVFLLLFFLAIKVAPSLAENNTDLIIVGPNTTNIAGTLIIGNTGTNTSLQISNAGAVTNGAGIIGNPAPASYNYVIVTN